MERIASTHSHSNDSVKRKNSDSGNVTGGESNGDGYENSNEISELEKSNAYSVVKAHDDYDYDEVYFEPATAEDELFEQLNTLSVPVILNQNLE